MSSFFTIPASQRKRKRDDVAEAQPSKKRPSLTKKSQPQKPKSSKPKRDESISSSGSENEQNVDRDAGGELVSSSDLGEGDETGAERRLRLAEQYLKNIKSEVDDVGFDAEEIDKDLIAERLQEDVAESKGRLYRHIASGLDYSSAIKTQFRANTATTTSIAVCPPYIYTVTKDIVLTKWELPTPPPPAPPRSTKNRKPPKRLPPPKARRPTKLFSTRGDKSKAGDSSYQHHTAPILTVAASGSGKFIATGGADKRLIIWSAADLTPLKVLNQHRDSVTSLAFRRGTHQLYSSSKDRTIKTWSLDELAYVETLFGHQDEVVDVAALAKEQCLSVGARDRSARMWKVVEETQLVFRGGGGGSPEKRKHQAKVAGKEVEALSKIYNEGSIDRVALIDEEMFVTGSDNGSLCLWTLQKKKPIFTVPLAHGLDLQLKPEEVYSDESPHQKVPGEPQPRWITALASVSYSDLIVSGSWDGEVRVWRISEDKRRIEALGSVGATGKQGLSTNTEVHSTISGEDDPASLRGIINDLKVFERGERGQDGLCIVAATGREHRLGRWKKSEGKNGAVVFEIPKLLQSRKTGLGQLLARADDAGSIAKL